MRRRDVVGVLGGALLLRPFAAPAQQPARPIIGLLDSAADAGTKLTSFYEGLKTEGFVKNQTVAVEYQAAEGNRDRLPQLAADLVDRKVAAIAAFGLPAALAAKAATTAIPIIFAIGSDPVQHGLVASLNRPGGNVTGVTAMGVAPEQKRLELLHQVIPAATTLALLVDPSNPDADRQTAAALTAARRMDLQVRVLHAGAVSAFDPAFAAVAREHAGGLAISDDELFFAQSARLAATALRREVPAAFAYRPFAATGGLMSYGRNLVEFYHQVGAYSGLVLRGASAADLPVFPATQTELIINNKTAKSLGLAIPATLLGRADDVIE
jgi:putative ABC transport system substrate-binding protein